MVGEDRLSGWGTTVGDIDNKRHGGVTIAAEESWPGSEVLRNVGRGVPRDRGEGITGRIKRRAILSCLTT